jgi:predicted O-methyltransferase YrrM
MNTIHRAISYFKFLTETLLLKSHSKQYEYVTRFTSRILCEMKNPIKELKKIEEIRNSLLRNKSKIHVIDLGTGSKIDNRVRCVSNIARKSSCSVQGCKLLYCIVKNMQPPTIIELGTSFGISTMAMATAAPGSKVITIEGCPETSEIARNNFVAMNIRNICQLTGSFEEHLPAILTGLEPPYLAFIDGNHQFEPTIQYFDRIASKSDNQSIVIIDDIHWSKEMEIAWKHICDHPKTSVSIDLYRMGIAFLNPALPKQRFNFIY